MLYDLQWNLRVRWDLTKICITKIYKDISYVALWHYGQVNFSGEETMDYESLLIILFFWGALGCARSLLLTPCSGIAPGKFGNYVGCWNWSYVNCVQGKCLTNCIVTMASTLVILKQGFLCLSYCILYFGFTYSKV